jgi:hypothetical protein
LLLNRRQQEMMMMMMKAAAIWSWPLNILCGIKNTSSWLGAKLIKHKGNFTFTFAHFAQLSIRAVAKAWNVWRTERRWQAEWRPRQLSSSEASVGCSNCRRRVPGTRGGGTKTSSNNTLATFCCIQQLALFILPIYYLPPHPTPPHHFCIPKIRTSRGSSILFCFYLCTSIN